jgi:hypothetical protein
MKKDLVGNPSSKQALSRVSWLRMGGSRLDEMKCERLVQSKRLDLKRVQNKGLPEETRVGEFLHLGNGLELHTSSTKVGVPERLLVMHYLTVLAEDREGIRKSKVYALEHPDFEYFQSMSALILARLEFLNQTLMYLILEEDLSRQVVWRYMMLFVEHAVLRGGSVRGPEQTGWRDAEGLVRPREPCGSVTCVGCGIGQAGGAGEGAQFGVGVQRQHERCGQEMAESSAVQERRAVRRAVRRGERRAVRRARAGEVLELVVSSAAGEGEGPGGGSILANH